MYIATGAVVLSHTGVVSSVAWLCGARFYQQLAIVGQVLQLQIVFCVAPRHGNNPQPQRRTRWQLEIASSLHLMFLKRNCSFRWTRLDLWRHNCSGILHSIICIGSNANAKSARVPKQMSTLLDGRVWWRETHFASIRISMWESSRRSRLFLVSLWSTCNPINIIFTVKNVYQHNSIDHAAPSCNPWFS